MDAVPSPVQSGHVSRVSASSLFLFRNSGWMFSPPSEAHLVAVDTTPAERLHLGWRKTTVEEADGSEDEDAFGVHL